MRSEKFLHGCNDVKNCGNTFYKSLKTCGLCPMWKTRFEELDNFLWLPTSISDIQA